MSTLIAISAVSRYCIQSFFCRAINGVIDPKLIKAAPILVEVVREPKLEWKIHKQFFDLNWCPRGALCRDGAAVHRNPLHSLMLRCFAIQVFT